MLERPPLQLEEYLDYLSFRVREEHFLESDDQVVVAGLRSDNLVCCEKAVALFGVLPYEIVLKVLAYYDSFSLSVKWLLVPFMGAMEMYQPFELLLKEYVFSENLAFVETLYAVLCRVEYAILPLLMLYFDSDELSVLSRAKRLLFGLGLEKCRLYLQLTPVILHESVFREVFGDEVIDKIVSEKY